MKHFEVHTYNLRIKCMYFNPYVYHIIICYFIILLQWKFYGNS